MLSQEPAAGVCVIVTGIAVPLVVETVVEDELKLPTITGIDTGFGLAVRADDPGLLVVSTETVIVCLSDGTPLWVMSKFSGHCPAAGSSRGRA